MAGWRRLPLIQLLAACALPAFSEQYAPPIVHGRAGLRPSALLAPTPRARILRGGSSTDGTPLAGPAEAEPETTETGVEVPPQVPPQQGIVASAAAVPLPEEEGAPADPAAVVPAAEPSTGATVGATVVNLVKAIVGSGVLSLPAAVAAYSSSRAAIGPAVLLLSLAAGLSAYCFALVARTCAATGSDSWAGAWEKTMGKRTAWLPSTLIVLKCFVACLAYTMVIGDAFSSIFGAAGAPAALSSRTGTILAFAACVLLPLSLLPSLDMLKYTSFLGVGGLVYTAVFMAMRAGAYSGDAPTALLGAVPAHLRPSMAAAPAGGALATLATPKVFVLVSVLATAFTAHYSAPRMFAELAPPAGEASGKAVAKVPRFCLVTGLGFGLSALLCAAVLSVGFGTFGGACSGLILNNYASTDPLAQLSRLAVGASIVCTYPIAFTGLRDGVFSLAAPDKASDPKLRLALTLGLISFITLCGILLTDLGIVAAVSGAVLASAVVYILPSIMWARVLAARVRAGTRGTKELYACRAVQVLGVIFGLVGVKVTLGG